MYMVSYKNKRDAHSEQVKHLSSETPMTYPIRKL